MPGASLYLRPQLRARSSSRERKALESVEPLRIEGRRLQREAVGAVRVGHGLGRAVFLHEVVAGGEAQETAGCSEDLHGSSSSGPPLLLTPVGEDAQWPPS